jgi:hypothetical protein
LAGFLSPSSARPLRGHIGSDLRGALMQIPKLIRIGGAAIPVRSYEHNSMNGRTRRQVCRFGIAREEHAVPWAAVGRDCVLLQNFNPPFDVPARNRSHPFRQPRVFRATQYVAQLRDAFRASLLARYASRSSSVGKMRVIGLSDSMSRIPVSPFSG